MAFLDYTDLERESNITLTDPEGRALADKKATATLAWAARRIGYTIAQGTVADTFTEGGKTFYLSNPTNPAISTVQTYNETTDTYETYPYSYRLNGRKLTLEIGLIDCAELKVTYTAGWSEAQFKATDLHQALCELLSKEFHEAQSDGKVIKRVSAGGYSEEYETASTKTNLDSVPADILEVVDSYRRPWAV